MYPCEPFSAAAFMNSASSCFRVSPVSFDGDAAERRLERATIASTSVTARRDRNLVLFMQPSENSADYSTPLQKRANHRGHREHRGGKSRELPCVPPCPPWLI